MRVALSTFWTWIRRDLPVVVERLAFSKSCDYDGAEGDDQEYSDSAQGVFIAAPPETIKNALQEFGYGEFGHPDAKVM